MLRLKDIFKAVCDTISNETNISIVDGDVDEPVVRPSFRVFMDKTAIGFYSSAIRSIKVYFEIYYYAKNKEHSKGELMDIEDTLAFIFLEPLSIKDNCAVIIDDVEFEKLPDGILNCSFDFEIGTEFIDDSELETMETLIIYEET